MNILMAFGSTEGHTRKIAHRINNLLQENGHASTLMDCASADPRPDLKKFDAIILAGSVHQEMHQPLLVEFVKKNLSELVKMPSAFISVSLSASIESGLAEAEKYVDEFIKETGWQPQTTHLAGGAIRFLEYDFFKRFTIEHIVLKGEKLPDPALGNPEYTDWEALDEFVETFLENVST